MKPKQPESKTPKYAGWYCPVDDCKEIIYKASEYDVSKHMATHLKKPRKSKYHNRKTTIDGIKFDSAKEAKRYSELKLLERAKQIRYLELQPEFILQIGFTDNMGVKHRAITYRADFRYHDDKRGEVVEDVKASLTFKTEVYRIKKKLFLYAYQDLIFKEVY